MEAHERSIKKAKIKHSSLKEKGSSNSSNFDVANTRRVLNRTKIHLLLVSIAVITSQFLIWPFVTFLVAFGGHFYPLDLLINSICVYLMLPLGINEDCWRLMTCFCCRVWFLMCKRCCRHCCCPEERKRKKKRREWERDSVELPAFVVGVDDDDEEEEENGRQNSNSVHVDGEGLDLLSESASHDSAMLE